MSPSLCLWAWNLKDPSRADPPRGWLPCCLLLVPKTQCPVRKVLWGFICLTVRTGIGVLQSVQLFTAAPPPTLFSFSQVVGDVKGQGGGLPDTLPQGRDERWSFSFLGAPDLWLVFWHFGLDLKEEGSFSSL